MAQQSRRKLPLNLTISPSLVIRINQEVESEKYSSQSDLVTIALTEFFVNKDRREHDQKIIGIYEKLLEDSNGREALSSIPHTPADQIEAMKKRGVSCVDLGDLDEAIKWFTRAKELEEKEQGSNESEGLPSTSTRRVTIE